MVEAVDSEATPAVRAALDGDDGALRLRLRVQPGAMRSCWLGPWPQRLRLAVASPPVDGKANAAVLAFVAETCALPGRAVSLVAGAGSRDKVVAIDGARRAVEAALVRALTDQRGMRR